MITINCHQNQKTFKIVLYLEFLLLMFVLMLDGSEKGLVK